MHHRIPSPAVEPHLRDGGASQDAARRLLVLHPRGYSVGGAAHPLGDDAQPAEARSGGEIEAQHHHHLDGVCQ